MAGIPDSGIGHAIGYANEARLPFQRPFVKYTPTWPRSFMPQDQDVRDLVARMKLIPIRELIAGQAPAVLRGLDRPRHPAEGHDPAALRLRRGGGAHAAGLPAPRVRLQVPELLALPLGAGPGRAAGRSTSSKAPMIDDLAEYANPAPPSTRPWSSGSAGRLNLTTLQYQRLDDLVDGHRPAEGEALHVLLGRRGNGLSRKSWPRSPAMQVRVLLQGPAIESAHRGASSRLSIRAASPFLRRWSSNRAFSSRP